MDAIRRAITAAAFVVLAVAGFGCGDSSTDPAESDLATVDELFGTIQVDDHSKEDEGYLSFVLTPPADGAGTPAISFFSDDPPDDLFPAGAEYGIDDLVVRPDSIFFHLLVSTSKTGGVREWSLRAARIGCELEGTATTSIGSVIASYPWGGTTCPCADCGESADGDTTYSDPPDVRELVFPEYPELARQAGIEGTVVAQVFITCCGDADSVVILQSPANIFIEPVKTAMNATTFFPARDGMQFVTSQVLVPIDFYLRMD